MPKLTKLFKIERIDNIIALNSFTEWQQEDIAIFKAHISAILSAEIKEHHLGADRECFRFAVSDYYFNLNFDVYSQSCWIDAEDQRSLQHLKTIFEQLNLR